MTWTGKGSWPGACYWCTQVQHRAYAQIRSSEKGTVLVQQHRVKSKKAQIRHGLGTGKTHFWHSFEQFRHSLGTVQAHFMNSQARFWDKYHNDSWDSLTLYIIAGYNSSQKWLEIE